MSNEITNAELGNLATQFRAMQDSDAFFAVDLSALNRSGVEGGAFMALDTDTNTLRVVTTADGVEGGAPHPEHIHGFPDAPDGSVPESTSPTLAQDDAGDGDGVIELSEGATTYGPIQLALTDPAGGSVENFPAPEGNSFVQVATYDLDELDAGANNADGEGATLNEVLTAESLSHREVVLHGLTLDGSQGEDTEGEADGTAGYKATLPIAAGEIYQLDTDTALADLADGRVEISNDVVAFDIDGNAGEAAGLYDTILDRVADKGGLTHYTGQLDDGVNLTTSADILLHSTEFTATFGDVDSMSDSDYVDLLYQNALGRDADDAGAQYWIGQLESGATQAELANAFSESSEHQMALVGQLDDGLLLDGTTA